MLCTFGIVRCNLVYFSRFGILRKEKSGNPGAGLPNRTRWMLDVIDPPKKLRLGTRNKKGRFKFAFF
jgi:hypothetical protein